VDRVDGAQIVYPFTGAISPYAGDVDQATLIWAEASGLLTDGLRQKSQRLQYGVLAARAYPQADRDTLQIAADWIAWLFFMDDQCDEAGIGRDPQRLAALHERFLAVLEGDPPDSGDWNLTRALADIRRRLAARATDDWLRRFGEHVRLYFTANRWEAANRYQSIVPNVATYCAARLFSGAVYACFDLIELAAGSIFPFMHVIMLPFNNSSGRQTISFAGAMICCRTPKRCSTVMCTIWYWLSGRNINVR